MLVILDNILGIFQIRDISETGAGSIICRKCTKGLYSVGPIRRLQSNITCGRQKYKQKSNQQTSVDIRYQLELLPVFQSKQDHFPHLVAEVDLASEISHILNVSQAMDGVQHNIFTVNISLSQTLNKHNTLLVTSNLCLYILVTFINDNCIQGCFETKARQNYEMQQNFLT